MFGDFVDRIYPIELELKDTTIQIGLFHTLTYTSKMTVREVKNKLCDKRDDFDFPIGNFPFICSNIPAAPAHEVNISRACGSHQDSVDRGLQLTWKLLNQGFLFIRLKSSLRHFCRRHH
jgi:hypothetical protein